MTTGPWPRVAVLLTALVLLLCHLPCVDAFLSVDSAKSSLFNTRALKVVVGDGKGRRDRCPALRGIKGFRAWFETTFPSAVITIDQDRDSYKHKTKKNNSKRKKGHSTSTEPENFDHVLIDANQYLHTTLRSAYNLKSKRSRHSIETAVHQDDVLFPDVIEHSLLLFMKELNRITRTTAIPQKSLVIAIDGSPGAAKLEMQRRRRFSIYKKAESQERQVQVLKQRGWRANDFAFSNGGKKINSIESKHQRERVSLNITPGTAYSAAVTDALLYFAYQYVTRFPGVWVYVSPSCMHGEGEVKLLDYIVHGHDERSSRRKPWTHVKENETVAIIGGDSDLVLMGLVVPPAITHNLHVILPEKKGRSLVVSVWETSRAMARLIEGTAVYGKATTKSTRKKKRRLALSQIRQARIDTALLIIMNGNDYLPKLRGCKGFDPFFKVYLDVLLRTWPSRDGGSDRGPRPFLIGIDESDELYLNVPFALAFFQALPSNFQSFQSYADAGVANLSSDQAPLLGTLNNLVDAKILPGPMSFETISPSDSISQREMLEMKSEMTQNTIDDVSANGYEIVRLTLGNYHHGQESSTSRTAPSNVSFATVRGESDGHGVISRMITSENSTQAGGRAYLFEVPHRTGSSMKSTKYRLAFLALEEIFGKENMDELFFDGSENESETPNGDSFVGKNFAKADAQSYLGGLMWNLETYHTGCCADYGYDYGRRPSPTPFELVEFLERQQREGRDRIKCFDLIERTSTSPLSDGLACLAAVPVQASHIVPEPYSRLVQPSKIAQFEALWESCVRPDTNAFDIQLFQKKCEEELKKARSERNGDRDIVSQKATIPDQNKGRHIHVGSEFWTAMSFGPPMAHPFEPPKPFSSRLSPLRKNKRVRCSKIPAKTPSRRSRNMAKNGESSREEDSKTRWNEGDDSAQSVHDVPYSLAFRRRNRK